MSPSRVAVASLACCRIAVPRPAVSDAASIPRELAMSTNTILLIILLFLIFGGGWGWSRRGR
ncbi:MAG: hypothetical protein V9E87_00165 [Gemmatimonadales bacterium]